MNKILIVGRMARDPQTQQTQSGIKYTRFTVAVNRQFTASQEADFIPIIAWRNQADFIDKYLNKGSLVSIEGRFTSNTFQNNENRIVTRYEVTADRVQALESKSQRKLRENQTNKFRSATATQVINWQNQNNPLEVNEPEHVNESEHTNEPEHANESKHANEPEHVEEKSSDVPWEIDL